MCHWAFIFSQSPLRETLRELKKNLSWACAGNFLILDGRQQAVAVTRMRFKLRHIFLILGITLTIFSFLFSGLSNGTYAILLSSGLLISSSSFLFILFKDGRSHKWLWSGIIVVAIVIQQLSEPLLIKYSYKILIDHNYTLFADVNKIMQSKDGYCFIQAVHRMIHQSFLPRKIPRLNDFWMPQIFV